MSAELILGEIAADAAATGELNADGASPPEQQPAAGEGGEGEELDRPDPGQPQPREQAPLDPASTDLAEISAAASPDINLDAGMVNAMGAHLQGIGLDEGQIAGVVKAYIGMQTNALGTFAERSGQSREGPMRDLKNEWGKNFDAHLEDARLALNTAAGPAATEIGNIMLANGGRLGDDPRLIRLFAQLGSRMQRPGPGVKNAGFISATTAEEQRDDLLSDEKFMKAWSTGDHPGHARAVKRMNDLTAVIGR